MTGKEFMEKVFKKIEHGDKEHRDWLHVELMQFASDLDEVIKDERLNERCNTLDDEWNMFGPRDD